MTTTSQASVLGDAATAKRPPDAEGQPCLRRARHSHKLAEHVEIVIRTWREQDFDHEGRLFVLKGQQLLPKPVQKPNPPLILGGRAGPRSVALAAKYADEYNTFNGTPQDAGRCRALLEAACAKVGRDPTSLRQSTIITAILGENDRDAEARAKRLLGLLAPGAPLASTIERARAAGLVASAANVAARVRPFEAQGVSRVFIQNFDFADPSSVALIGELAHIHS